MTFLEALSHPGGYSGPKGREVSIYFKAHPSISPDAAKLLNAVFHFLLSPFNVQKVLTP